MLPQAANPEVGYEDTPEMEGVTKFQPIDVDSEFTDEVEEAESAQPSAAVPAPTSRRSKAEAEGLRPPASPTPNLDDNPDFRAWKSKQDRALAEERNRRLQAEQALQAQAAQQQAAYMQAQLQAGLADENLDDAGRAQLVRQMATQMASQEALGLAQGWRAWEQHVQSEVSKAGLDVTEFDPFSYQGEPGRVAFERDLAAKRALKLEQERDDLRQAAAPETIAKMVQAEVAKFLQAQGLNQVDTGKGALPASTDSWERDRELLRQGKLPRGYLAKKYGNP
jgi:hypothetical protein